MSSRKPYRPAPPRAAKPAPVPAAIQIAHTLAFVRVGVMSGAATPSEIANALDAAARELVRLVVEGVSP